jgi:hypothetical protein
MLSLLGGELSGQCLDLLSSSGLGLGEASKVFAQVIGLCAVLRC